ncbi:class I SAM-dependent methyltransferase [uncultured Bradyrhizobium sp.]|uniref:class I SAM-dependent methyltransferase n=1 Tax=Bradyrhizobium sp. TaxID=376 RepID=UPI002606E544|nr:class I SAM-dependent methyltransferase [uncultured Bradyrhizobium sp.]
MYPKITGVDQRLHDYLLIHRAPEHPELAALREATQQLPEGIMQITPEQGHLLALLVRLMTARRTLEIGTFTGYSALAVALALPADGRLVTLDIDDAWPSIGHEYWQRAGVAGKIEVKIASAVETLRQLENDGAAASFDLAFIDADKPGYDDYYESALRLVRPGGLIVLDNMLRRGRVADPTVTDDDTVALRKLNKKIAADERVDRILLPIATGMTFARRRSLN